MSTTDLLFDPTDVDEVTVALVAEMRKIGYDETATLDDLPEGTPEVMEALHQVFCAVAPYISGQPKAMQVTAAFLRGYAGVLDQAAGKQAEEGRDG